MLSLLLTLGAPFSFAQSSDQAGPDLAGRVIVVSGDVIARGADGDRPLSRREAIYVGDTIFTDVAASAQIRMVDDALIALKESTEFAIVAYTYEQDISSDESAKELIQGGFRTITGNIGQQNKDAYEAIIGDFATIGIRGTDFEAVITENGVFTGVYDGGATIANGVGSLDLGFSADFDFAQVATPNSPPTGLLLQPVSLGNTPFAATLDEKVESSGDEDQDSEIESTDEPDSANSQADDSSTSDEDTATTTRDGDDASTDVDQIPASSGSSEQIDNSASSASLELEAPTTELAREAAQTGAANAISRDTQQDDRASVSVHPSETGTGGSVPCSSGSSRCQQLLDNKLTDEDKKDNTGTAGNSGNNGNSGSGDDTTTVIVTNDDGTTTTTVIATNDDGTTTTTTATTTSGSKGNGNSGNSGNGKNDNGNFGTNSSRIQKPALTIDAASISWGKWNNRVDENFVVVTQQDDGLVRVATSEYFAQVNPTPVAKLTGSHSYATTIISSFIGSGSAGDISDVIAGMQVDFDPGAISQGSLDILVDDQSWAIEFDGSIRHGIVDLNAVNGQLFDNSGLISNSIDANLGGVSLGIPAQYSLAVST